MELFHHTFSDVYAHQDNWVTKIDIRVKLIYVISMLSVNLWAKNIFVPIFFFTSSIIILLSVKIPIITILRRFSIPLMLALFILLIKGLYEGETAWLSFSAFGYDVVLKEEGMHNGIFICSRVLGGVSLVLLLSFTTTISRLSAGLKWMHIPNTIIELLSFIYRYIFLFLDEVSIIWVAQKTRLGYSSWATTIKSFGTLAGLLFIRSFERAERTYEAMTVRGYDGSKIVTSNIEQWNKREYFHIIGIVCILIALVYTGNLSLMIN